MGKRDRLHREAVIAGTEQPYRASPGITVVVEPVKPRATESIAERALRLQKG